MQRIKPPHIVIAVVLFVIGAFMLPQILADQPGARTVQDNLITETIAVTETNATVAFTVRMLEGSDPEHESSHMFEALAGLPGVGTASLNTETLQFTVAYDDSVTDATPIRSRLLESGYVSPTRDDATPLAMAQDRSVQRISVSDTGTGFDPFLMLAEAGVPVEIEFAPGQECRVSVSFPELGIQQDIGQGATVSLPALEPGEYQIACSGDVVEARLIVE